MSGYQITIQMSDATVDGLQGDGYQLYAFKAVEGSGGGVPVVWFSSSTFSQSTVVSWTEAYQAYTAQAMQLGSNVTISTLASYPIELGEQLNVTNPEGTGVVVSGGPDPQAIAVLNQTANPPTPGTPMTCGISQQQGDGSYQPLCAFPLTGVGLDLIVPIEKVFLMFATLPVNTGTVIEKSYGPGVLVDLTSANQQSVAYDIDAGWTPQPWAAVYPATTALVPLLISPS